MATTDERTFLRSASGHQQPGADHRWRSYLTLLGVLLLLPVAVLGGWVLALHNSSRDEASAPIVEEAQLSAAGAVQICRDTKQEAGYIALPNKQDDQYFYWFFESRSRPESDPLVLYLQGGPGCSGLTSLLWDNGPCFVLPNLTTIRNPHSWTNEANVIWLDQPTNVGFSFGSEEDGDHNEDDVQESIFWFLQGFLDKHSEFIGRPLYLMGASYAGHFAPAAAHYIWQRQQQQQTPRDSSNKTVHPLNLQGIALGNALVNLVTQTAHALDMVRDNAYNITLMNASELARAQNALPKCLAMLKACLDEEGVDACPNAFAFCAQEHHQVPLKVPNRNQFDIRMQCQQAECYDMSSVTKYLNSAPVQAHLSVRKRWEECTPEVGAGFMADTVQPFDRYVADLLDHSSDVRVLVYAGDADLVCNWSGSLAWMLALDWQHKREFNEAEEHAFVLSSEDRTQEEAVAGTVRTFENQFTFVRVFSAGHKLPHDQPVVASEMINRLLRNEAF
ncbi:Serine protease family s10 [Globisporangium polare]